jgi:hypothetical protein
MGYRNDANFNITWTYEGESGSHTSPSGKENPPFLFPDKSIRFLDAESALERARNRPTTIADGNYKIHRGYIRNLEQPQFGLGLEFPISRCNFQFNPQQIQQTVGMRDDIYLPLLQAPEQLAQPIGANTNFQFDLLFDRSHELAKGNLGLAADLANISPNDPYDIGVLADLRVFYSVIGQGFSAEMIEFQRKMFDYNAKNAWESENSQPKTGTTSGNTSSTDTTDSDTASTSSSDTSTPPTTPNDPPDWTKIDSVINANIGNFALLMPNPVRVMFSSLFMLDGFITSTSVDFLKFSSNMVPLSCRIGVTMNAMYIGFAREKTFLTDVFDAAAAAAAAREAETAAANEELSKLWVTTQTFGIGAVETAGADTDYGKNNAGNFDGGAKDQWPLIVQGKSAAVLQSAAYPDTGLVPQSKVWQATLATGSPVDVGGVLYDSVITFAVGFTNIRPLIGLGRDTDKVLRYYETDGDLTVDYEWSVNIWGGNPKYGANYGLTVSEAKAKVANNTYTEVGELYHLLGSYQGSATSSTKDEWGSGEKNGIRQYLPGVENTAVDAAVVKNFVADQVYNEPWDLDTTDIEPGSWYRSAYYIVEWSASATLKNSVSSLPPKSAKRVEVLNGERTFNTTLHLGTFDSPEYTGGPFAPISVLDVGP